MTFIKNSLIVLVVILFLDFACFMWWGMSGQKPVDGAYAGTISAHIISAIVSK